MSRNGIYITERDGMAVVKLDSGYNIGVIPGSCTVIGHRNLRQEGILKWSRTAELPNLSIVSTGGTIASRIDYRTGLVTSQFNASDILLAIPELAEIANYRTIPLATILSENMTPAIWQDLARTVYDEIRGGVRALSLPTGQTPWHIVPLRSVS